MIDTEVLKYIFFKKQKKEDHITYYKLQASIIDKLDRHRFAMCFDEVGLGKTVQGIYAIWNILQKKKADEYSKILIVTPNERIAQKWKQEIETFLCLNFSIVNNRDDQCFKYDPNNDSFCITYNSSNYNNLGLSKLTRYSGSLPKDNYWDINTVMSSIQQVFYNCGSDFRPSILKDPVNYNSFTEDDKEAYYDVSEYAPADKEKLIYDLLLYKENNKHCDPHDKYICMSTWDLIILDEADCYYENYYKALFRERIEVNNKKNYYFKHLAWHKANQLLVLTATPLKETMGESQFERIMSIPQKLLLLPPSNVTIELEKLLDFDIDIPYQRYFKEVVLNHDNSKSRNVIFKNYPITEKLRYIWSQVNGSPYQDCCNVFLLIKKFIHGKERSDTLIQSSYSCYIKPEYIEDDIRLIRQLDTKISVFIDYLLTKDRINILIFCSRIETGQYIEKVLRFLNIETVTLRANQKDILEQCNYFNESDNTKKALITSWEIGSVGLNLHGADTVICYEPVTLINKIEQGFGRIDRIGLGFDDISMIYFKPDENWSIYDNYRINSIYHRLFTQHLPNIPSKNIMFDTDYLDHYVDLAYKKYEILNGLDRFLSSLDDTSEVSIGIAEMKDYCKKNDYDITLLEYEFHPTSSKINLEDIKNRLAIWKEIKDGIDTFVSSVQKTGRSNGSPSELLKEAIYYYDNDILKVTSVKQLLNKVSNFNPDSNHDFITSIEYIENNTADIVNKSNYQAPIIERYSKVFAECIQKKLNNSFLYS